MTPDAVKTEAKKLAPKKPAAKSKGDINKSAEIRKVAAGMKAKGEKPRPVVIIEMLKKQGVEVSSPQVSMVLKKMGFRPRKRRKTGLAKARAISATGSKTTKVKVEDLVKAQKVAEQMGGIEKAIAALQALKGFE
jgi:transposase